jgi:hypothetical protein
MNPTNPSVVYFSLNLFFVHREPCTVNRFFVFPYFRHFSSL